MSTISLRLNAKDEKLIREYARIHNLSVSDLIRTAVIEKIEDQVDLSLFDQAFEKTTQFFTLAEAKKELGLIE